MMQFLQRKRDKYDREQLEIRKKTFLEETQWKLQINQTIETNLKCEKEVYDPKGELGRYSFKDYNPRLEVLPFNDFRLL